MIQVIERIAKIIEMLATEGNSTLEKISVANALNHGTVCNILRSLIEAGWVERSGHGSYRLTGFFRELGNAPAWKPQLIAYLDKKLRSLADSIGESLVISTIRYSKVVVMSQADYEHSLMVNNQRIYAKMSLYTSVSGEVLCAGLAPRDRQQLYRVNPPTPRDLADDGDLDGYEKKLRRINSEGQNVSCNESLSIKSWAIPIYDNAHAICACIGLSVPLVRLPEDGGGRYLAEMRQTAAEISQWFAKVGITAQDIIRLPFVS